MMTKVPKDFKYSVTTKSVAYQLGVSAETVEENIEFLKLIDKCKNNPHQNDLMLLQAVLEREAATIKMILLNPKSRFNSFKN